MNLTLLCLCIFSFVVVTSNAASPSYRYGTAANEPRRTLGFGKGLYDFLFGPWPRRPNYEMQRPTYNRPKPDFANDKVPDYDLYLLGWTWNIVFFQNLNIVLFRQHFLKGEFVRVGYYNVENQNENFFLDVINTLS